MLQIRNAEEKKRIIAYHMARNNQNLGIEKVWRIWNTWWDNDFVADGRKLKMYNHTFVLSKNKAKERMRKGETIQEFKAYDDFLVEVCKWVKDNYDETKGRNANADALKNNLLKYRMECNRNIRVAFNKSGLKQQGYRLQRQISKKHPLLLSKYIILIQTEDGGTQCIKQGGYDEITEYLNAVKRR